MDKQVKDVADKVAARAAGQSDLVAVIPAGGIGGQLFPVTSGMPKALLPLNTKPLLVHILEQLSKSSVFGKCIISSNEWHPMIRDYIESFCSRISIEYECVKTDKLRSAFLKELLTQGKLSDPFLLHYCDVFVEKVNWKRMLQTYENGKGEMGAIGALLVSRYFNYSVGVFSIDPADNRIKEFRQKPQEIVPGYANCAVGLFSKEFVENYVDENESDIFGKAFQQALSTGRLIGFPVGVWHHFQQIRDWLQAQKTYYKHIPV